MNVCGTNEAVTALAASIVRVQLAPVQSPVQPLNFEAKVEVIVGVAVSVTLEPCVKLAVQVPLLQPLIPAGELSTVPVADPVLLKVTCSDCVGTVPKFATTVVSDVPITTAQVPVPGHVAALPFTVQPVNCEPVAGVAVKVTVLPLSKLAEQVDPQFTPTGEVVTVPVPAPVVDTETRYLAGSKLATTVSVALMVTVQVPVPGQVAALPFTVQPVKLDVPAAGVAVSVTDAL